MKFIYFLQSLEIETNRGQFKSYYTFFRRKGKENAKNLEEVPNKLEDEKEEEEDEESDEEYSPKKKTRKTMKSPPNKRKLGGITNPVSAPPCLKPNTELPKPFSKPNSNTANPLSIHNGKMKENGSLTPSSDFTKISVTSQPSSKPSSYTPLQSVVKVSLMHFYSELLSVPRMPI